MSEHVITTAEEMKEHGQLVTEIHGREIAIFYIDGELYAYTNWCPHQSGPAFEGDTCGYRDATFDRETLETKKEWTRENEIIACPWHGWEFDLKTGECLTKKDVVIPQYDVGFEDGNVVLEV
jgi:nitrite reductase/ring-hydroxylating ferredoxin subunit